MNKVLIVLALILTGVSGHAQEWIKHGGAEYNCAVLNDMLNRYGERAFMRDAHGTTSFAEFFALFFPSCPQPSRAIESGVSPPQTVERTETPGTYVNSPALCYANIRECPSTNCALLQRIGHGHHLHVVAREGSWSKIRLQNWGRAYIFNELLSNSPPDMGICQQTTTPTVKPKPTATPSPQATRRPTVRATSSLNAAPDGSYRFSSQVEGLRPVIGPITLRRGVYVFTATTAGYMIVQAKSVSSVCGNASDLMPYPIFNLFGDAGKSGAQSVVSIVSTCRVLLEISNVSEDWTLEIHPVS